MAQPPQSRAGGAPAPRRSSRQRGSKHLDGDQLDDPEAMAEEPASTNNAALDSGASEEGKADPDELFAVKRRRRNEPPRCRVPDCNEDLDLAYHVKHRICARHYKAPSFHVAGRQWRFCQQCAKFHELPVFVGDMRSCNKSLRSHNRRRRGLPRPRSSGATTATPAAATADGSDSSSAPPKDATSSPDSPLGPASIGQQQSSTPPALTVPLQPELEPLGLPWPAPAEPPSAVHQGRVLSAPLPPMGLTPLSWRGEDDAQFDSALLGLLLSDPQQQPGAAPDGQANAHAHATLLDAYDTLLDGAAGAPTVPSSHDLLEIADELGIFADHLVEPMAADAGAAAATTPPPPSEELNNAVAAYPSSSSGATASSSGNAAALPRFLDAPAGAVAAVAAAVQAAADAGMPPLPAWQLQQQEAAAVALRLHGGKQGSSPPLMMGGSYASPFQLERLAFKVFGCHPDQLAPDVRNELQAILGVHAQHMDGFVRPGCTYLTVDLHLDQQRAAALLGDASASGPDDAGASTSAQLPHCSSSKQLDDGAGADGCEGAGSTAAPCAASGDARAALLQRLACQLLQRRSMGDVGSAGPMLLQLNAHHLAVVAGGRLLRCMPLPTQAPAPAAAAALAAPAPAIPHLLAVSPSVLVLPPPPPPGSSASCEPAVLALTGHGLWDKAGAPGLVLCRQHGRHLSVEVWGSTPGSGGAPGALIVAVPGLRPGACELEVQRGSVLGNSRTLLVLPAEMEAAAAELRAPWGGAAGDVLWRDVGAVAAWMAHREQGAPQPQPHAPFCTEDVLGSGWSSSEEEEAEEEGEDRAHGRSEGQVSLLPAASVAALARHAMAHTLCCGWQATAAMLESAATAAQAAAGTDAVAAAPAAPAPAPGWLAGSTQLQRDEHALDFDYWSPLWQQQLQREAGLSSPPAGPGGQLSAWWQAAAGGGQQMPEEQCDRLTVEGIKTALGTRDGGCCTRALRPWVAAAAVLSVVAVAVLVRFLSLAL